MTLAWGLIPPAQLPPAGLVDELNQRGGLRDELFVHVGYGVIAYHKQGPVSYELSDRRGMATSSFMALGPDLLCLLINAVTGDGGPCFGDSGGPEFLGDSNLIVSVTAGGDHQCRAMSLNYRLDVPSARTFLAGYVALP